MGMEIAGTPSAVHGEFIIGSPVDSRPAGAGPGAEGAGIVASKLRRVLGEQSATTAEGVIIPLQVSVGWSCYPANGASAGELVHAAVRAMQREKGGKEGR